MAEREDTVMLGLGGNSEDVEDDGEGDAKLRDDHLLESAFLVWLFQPLVQAAISKSSM